MSHCDCDEPQAWSETRRRARKEHQCNECYTPIRVGEFYMYASGIWDGEPNSFHRHIECVRWSDALSEEIRRRPELGLCECFPIGRLRGALEEFCEEAFGYRADGKPRWAA